MSINRTTVALTLAAMLATAGAAAAATPEGVWQTATDHAEVQITSNGGVLEGRIVTSDQLKATPDQRDVKNKDVSLRGRPLKGLPMLTGLSGGPTTWSGGHVYNPADGKTYTGQVKLLDADRLKLTGCVVKPFCKSETWKRLR